MKFGTVGFLEFHQASAASSLVVGLTIAFAYSSLVKNQRKKRYQQKREMRWGTFFERHIYIYIYIVDKGMDTNVWKKTQLRWIIDYSIFFVKRHPQKSHRFVCSFSTVYSDFLFFE